MRYLTVRKFSSESGYTEAAIRSKIQDGTWLEDRVWRHAPDGRVLIDVEGYEAWVEMGKPSRAYRGRSYQPGHNPSPHLSNGSKSGSPPPIV